LTSRKQQLKAVHEALIAIEQYEKLIENQKLVAFRPIHCTDQTRFYAEQTKRIRVVLGGNRTGKTTIGHNEAVAHSLGYRPWYPQGHPLRIVRLTNGNPIPVPNVGRIVAQNYTQAIVQTIMKKFEEWAPKNEIKSIKNNSRGVPVQITWKNDSVIHLMTDDQDDMAFEGPWGHWFWIDEPCGYRKFTGLSRGLVDYDGHGWMTMTPLTQPWINDILVSRAGDKDSGIAVYKLSIWDNCVENGGYLTRQAIEAFLSDIREDEFEARTHGNFLHLAGLVYKQWEPRPPFYIDPHEIPDSWPRVCVLDPHPRKPLAMLWAACSPSDGWKVYRTIFSPSIKTIADAAQRIMYEEKWESPRNPGPGSEPVVLRIIDWSAEANEPTSGLSIRKMFTQISPFLHHVKANKANAQAGYDAIHEALKIHNEWSEPRLQVFNNCRELKHDFMNFCFDEWGTSRQRDRMGEKQGYMKTNDDFIDCVRYIFQHNLTYAMLKRMMNDRSEKWDRIIDNEVMGNGSIFSRTGTRTGIGV